jgi:hypothetical protein
MARINEAANADELNYIIEKMADDERITNEEYSALYSAAIARFAEM